MPDDTTIEISKLCLCIFTLDSRGGLKGWVGYFRDDYMVGDLGLRSFLSTLSAFEMYVDLQLTFRLEHFPLSNIAFCKTVALCKPIKRTTPLSLSPCDFARTEAITQSLTFNIKVLVTMCFNSLYVCHNNIKLHLRQSIFALR